jgi:hypothetical protein
VECDVVGPVRQRASDLNITFAVTLVKKFVLRAFDGLHMSDLAAGHRLLGNVFSAFNARIFRAANVYGPHEVGLLRLDRRNRRTLFCVTTDQRKTE